MTLYNWSSPNTDPSFIQISILRPVLSILPHAPPPYKIQDLAAPNNPFFLGGGSVINEARAALRGFDPATTKISEPLYVLTGIRADFWNECE